MVRNPDHNGLVFALPRGIKTLVNLAAIPAGLAGGVLGVLGALMVNSNYALYALGAFIGFFYGALSGAVVGWTVAWLYNRIAYARSRS